MSGFRNPLTPERLQASGRVVAETAASLTDEVAISVAGERLAGASMIAVVVDPEDFSVDFGVRVAQEVAPGITDPLAVIASDTWVQFPSIIPARIVGPGDLTITIAQMDSTTPRNVDVQVVSYRGVFPAEFAAPLLTANRVFTIIAGGTNQISSPQALSAGTYTDIVMVAEGTQTFDLEWSWNVIDMANKSRRTATEVLATARATPFYIARKLPDNFNGFKLTNASGATGTYSMSATFSR